MFGIGTPELVIFAIVLLVLFGGAKLPSLMRNMGRSVNEFKAGIKEKPKEFPQDSDEPSKVGGNSSESEKEEEIST
ncbi:MAG: twin-arginine translocase TatA/TatE family subunit [Planctomycetota bacterium]